MLKVILLDDGIVSGVETVVLAQQIKNGVEMFGLGVPENSVDMLWLGIPEIMALAKAQFLEPPGNILDTHERVSLLYYPLNAIPVWYDPANASTIQYHREPPLPSMRSSIRCLTQYGYA